ncbi:MAG: hypothetical protein WCE64_12550 [Bacteroidales bacterium]
MLTNDMNFIRRLLSATLLFIISLTASGQKLKEQVVVLNDGTCLLGIIVADSSDCLKVRIRRPRVITISKSKVYSTGNVRTRVTGSADKKGYSIRLTASILAGRNSSGKVGTMSFHLSNGYQFSNGLSAGLGTGIEKLDLWVMPVYADLRFQPLKTSVSPFAWVKSGYGFALSGRTNEDYYYYGYNPEPVGGIMFSTGAGIALYSWRRNAVSIGIGYHYQKIRFRQQELIGYGELTNELITHFNRIEVQFGFIFR